MTYGYKFAKKFWDNNIFFSWKCEPFSVMCCDCLVWSRLNNSGNQSMSSTFHGQLGRARCRSCNVGGHSFEFSSVIHVDWTQPQGEYQTSRINFFALDLDLFVRKQLSSASEPVLIDRTEMHLNLERAGIGKKLRNITVAWDFQQNDKN
jgi:hypothetical protein